MVLKESGFYNSLAEKQKKKAFETTLKDNTVKGKMFNCRAVSSASYWV